MRTLTNRQLRIAVDASGGDEKLIPKNPVTGAIMATLMNPEIFVQLVGQRDEIRRTLAGCFNPKRMEIVDAPGIIEMGDSVAIARTKRDSSIHAGLNLLQSGETDAFVSAGNTAAITLLAHHMLGSIEGIDKPAIATVFPTGAESPCVLLDVGGILGCKAENLFQFGVMGAVYCEAVLNIPRPRVALLNVGEENSKGDEIISGARKLFENFSMLNFTGFVEGGDILSGKKADVIVVNGFTGNILLKLTESFLPTLSKALHQRIDTDFAQKFFAGIARWLLGPTLGAMKRRFHYEQYGGAPLLGLARPVIIAHGKSSSIAIASAIEQGSLAAKLNINSKTEKQIALSKSVQQTA